MTDFSIKEAALTGFRFAREHPGAILAWAVVSLISTFLYSSITISMAGEEMGRLVALNESMQADPTTADPTVIFPLMGAIYSAMFVSFIPLLIAGAILTGAATRGVLRPEASGLGYLRFGADELRLIIVLIVVGILLGVIFMVGSVLASIVGVIVMIAASGGEPPTPGAMTVPMLAGMAPIIILACLVMLFVYGRFSMAAPLTVDRRAINIFSSVTLTKGMSVRLFKSYFLAFLLYFVVVVLGGCVFLGVAAVMTGSLSEVADFYMKPDMSSAATFFTPLRIVYLVLTSVFSALGAAIMLTPPVAIYKALTSEGVDEIL